MSRDDSFEDLRTLFAADLLKKVKALQAALRDANWDQIDRISHQIIGTAESFGYPEISAVASELQQSASEKRLDSSEDLLKKISDLIVL